MATRTMVWEKYGNFRLTQHARERMEEREIPAEAVEARPEARPQGA